MITLEYVYRWWMKVERPRMIEQNGRDSRDAVWKITPDGRNYYMKARTA